MKKLLIATSLLTDLDFYFLLSLCFCFSTTWFILNIISAWLLISLADRLLNTTSKPHELYIASMIYSLIYLSAAIVLTYTFDWTFHKFIIVAYCFIFFRIGWTLLWDFITNKINK